VRSSLSGHTVGCTVRPAITTRSDPTLARIMTTLSSKPGARAATAAPAYRLGVMLLVGAIAVILGALAFEYIGRLEPCPLCLQQRWAYYAAIPVTFLALVVLAANHERAAALLLFLVALGFLANAGLGVYHAGAEWKFWPGPATCGGTALRPLSSGGGLLKDLATTRVVPCDEAAWRFAGLSLAGWNVITSLFLMILGLKAAFAAVEPNR
jgi:disulfide bond formation protein DsbB